MERSRPDRHKGYNMGFKVGLLLALSMSFSQFTWDLVDEYYYQTNLQGFYLLLTLSCLIGNILGAVLGANLAKNLDSLTKVAALGTLLDVPIVMYCFSLLNNLKTVGWTPLTSDLIWTYVCGLTSALGQGMLLTAAYSYSCKKSCGLSNGRQFGSLFLTWQFSNLITMIWVYLMEYETKYVVMAAGFVTLIVAVLWLYMPRPNQMTEHLHPYTEATTYSYQFKAVLTFLSFACVGTGMQWGTEMVIENLNLNAHVVKLCGSLVFSTGIGSSILFGWGFDAFPPRMMKLWLAAAVSALVCYFGAIYGFFEAMAVFTVMFTWMTTVGVQVLMLAFITHHNKGCEIYACAAWVSVWFVGDVLTLLSMRYFRNSYLNMFYLGVVILVSGILVFTKDWISTTQKYVPHSPTYKQRLE